MNRPYGEVGARWDVATLAESSALLRKFVVTYHDRGREVQKDTALFGLEVLGYGTRSDFANMVNATTYSSFVKIFGSLMFSFQAEENISLDSSAILCRKVSYVPFPVLTEL